jgi:hypothetical protein
VLDAAVLSTETARPPRNAQDLQAYRLPQPKPFLASLSIEAVLILLYHFVLVESILNR